jgi:hypothetical protein
MTQSTFYGGRPIARAGGPFVLSLAMALGLLACGHPFEATPPPGFVEFEGRYQSNEYRAASADGVVIGVRAFENDPKGELAFWSRAIENRMRNIGGYALLEKRTVKCRGELTGTQLRFGHDEGKEPHLYYVTIFVNDKRVFLLEAGGTKTEMTKVAGQIDASVTQFLPK